MKLKFTFLEAAISIIISKKKPTSKTIITIYNIVLIWNKNFVLPLPPLEKLVIFKIPKHYSY